MKASGKIRIIRFHRKALVASIALFSVLLVSTGTAAPSIVVENSDLKVMVQCNPGITVTSIRDTVTGHEYLPRTSPLFELAVNNGMPIPSDRVQVQSCEASHIVARADSLDIDVTLTASRVDPAVVVGLSLRNTGPVQLFVRAVFPKFQGLIAPGDWSQNMGMIPQEIGVVTPLHLAPAAAHVAPLLRNSPGSCGVAPNAQQDMFVVGNDGAFWTQFECNNGAWTAPIRLHRASLAPPGAQVAAVRRNDHQEDVFVIANDGAVWTTYEVNDGTFTTVRLWDGSPIAAPPGGGIAAVARNDRQEDVFFIGNDGAIWTSSETGDSAFSQPVRLSEKGLFRPGAPIAAVMRNNVQEDVFAIDNNRALQTVFFNGSWNTATLIPDLAASGAALAAVVRNDHQEDLFVIGRGGSILTAFETYNGRWSGPIRLAASGLGESGGEIAAVRRNDHQEDVFWVDASGRINTLFETYDRPWSNPIPIGPMFLARPGAPIAAIKRDDQQEDVHVIGSAGEVVTFYELNDSAFIGPVPLPFPDPIGKKFNIDVGLPNSMNAMEVASLYDPAGGGGLFLADISGYLEPRIFDPSARLSPLQFTLSAGEAVGFWINDVAAGASVQLPSLAIGVTHSGDWHAGVDFYARTSPGARATPVHRPSWLDNAGAIYAHTGGGAGSIYLQLGGTALKDQINTFRDLPRLLQNAEQLNTNIVYLLDYWQGPPGSFDGPSVCAQAQANPYLNKGDYIPRLDLGGEEALKQGIADIHTQSLRPGRIIMYLEPFIIYRCSNLAGMPVQVGPLTLSLGQLWAARDPLGTVPDLLGNLYGAPPWKGGYQDNFSMVAPFQGWQEYITDVATRLVGQYGADGVFLDSWSWQMNWPVHSLAELTPNGLPRSYSPREDSLGVLALTDKVRQEIQKQNPQAVVLSETPSGPVGNHLDGGLGAEFSSYSKDDLGFTPVEYIPGRIVASPTRYGAPGVRYFSNGHDLNELNQVFAAGHGLALCCNSDKDTNSFIHKNALRIARLVQWRLDYGDALIHGRQRYQPKTGDFAVAAYSYLGTRNRILTIVNTSVAPYDGAIQLDSDDARFSWHNLDSSETLLTNSAGRLSLHIPAEEVVVLQASAN